MRNLRVSLLLTLLCNLFIATSAQAPSKKNATLEQIIHRFISPYGLSLDNQFKLSAYAELKGDFSNRDQSLSLNFGDLGYLSFFTKNCLLRSGSGVFHLNRYQVEGSSVKLVDERLTQMFENIILLGNGTADMDHINFVDKHLARKNIEPFDKIFVRHILIKYGVYDPLLGQVVFETKNLPDEVFAAAGTDTKNQIWLKKYSSELKIRLDEKILRGYYLKSGGTVYVEDVKRKVFYATGEEYDDNVTAFKVFIQKLFVQSAQYIVQNEAERLRKKVEKEDQVVTEMVSYDSSIDHSRKFVPKGKRARKARQIKPLYDPHAWIPMMLGMLKRQKIEFSDKEVLPYFIEREDFDLIYQQLSLKEQGRVDVYRASLEK